jgi:murein DD-endopeptidase MepM/ murein hydrolase activator NlpD
VPSAGCSAWPSLATRAVVAVCAFTLLATVLLVSPGPVTASDLGDRIASGRRSQAYYESVMLSADRAIAQIKPQVKVARKALRASKRSVRRIARVVRSATAIVERRRAHLAELATLYADTPAEEVPANYADRVDQARRDLQLARAHKIRAGKWYRIAVHARAARHYRMASLKRQWRAAISRRESAEGGLGAYIVRMTELGQQRAELQSDAVLGRDSGFTWPAVGRLSQGYGCTGMRLLPRRGSCAHFHDGLDVVSAYGSSVASMADGVVAYAGWNPWDEGGRAWLMVVSHPDGWVSRYGHLIAGSATRVGEFVRQGQTIGRMGNTGRSTGTHLHFELLRNDATVDPRGYLPAGMVTEKVRHHRHHKGHGAHGDRSRRGQRVRNKPKVEQASAPLDAATVVCLPAAWPLPDGQGLPGTIEATLASSGTDTGAGRIAAGDPSCSDLGTGESVAAMTSASIVSPSARAEAARRAADAGVTASGVPRPFRGTSPAPV